MKTLSYEIVPKFIYFIRLFDSAPHKTYIKNITFTSLNYSTPLTAVSITRNYENYL